MNEDFQYVILAGITLLVAGIFSLILRKIMTVFINRRSKFLKVNPTNFLFVKNSISFIVLAFAIFWLFHKIPYLNSLGNALFASAGILAAILGFASQKAFSNLIGGVFILIFKPFGVDDVIELLDGKKGIVEEITLRHTIIKDYENRRIVIPNSVINEAVIINSSLSDDKIRKHIQIGIAYDANVDLAIEVIRKHVIAHPLFSDVRTKKDIKDGIPEVEILLVSLGDFSINLRAYVWTKNNDDAFRLQCDILKSVKHEFDEKGIEIPFPYRTLVFKDPSRPKTLSRKKK